MAEGKEKKNPLLLPLAWKAIDVFAVFTLASLALPICCLVNISFSFLATRATEMHSEGHKVGRRRVGAVQYSARTVQWGQAREVQIGSARCYTNSAPYHRIGLHYQTNRWHFSNPQSGIIHKKDILRDPRA